MQCKSLWIKASAKCINVSHFSCLFYLKIESPPCFIDVLQRIPKQIYWCFINHWFYVKWADVLNSIWIKWQTLMHKLASVQVLTLIDTFSFTYMKSNGLSDLSALAGVRSKLLSIKSRLETSFGIKPLLLYYYFYTRSKPEKCNSLFNYEYIINTFQCFCLLTDII